MAAIPIISGLHEIAGEYDALICDVWGVIHNGVAARPEAVEALQRYRQTVGPVVLLTNAPRPVADIKQQFARLNIPENCYDAILTSGVAARMEMEKRGQGRVLPFYYLGPDRDRGVFEGLNAKTVSVEEAELILCTGLLDDTKETPDDYASLLSKFKTRNLPFLCANPDLVVIRGTDRVYCAGAIAQAYEKIGGEVVYFGKPFPAVYDLARTLTGKVMHKPLAIGDGLMTDIKGAVGAGIDTLFIADGIHGEELGALTPENVERLFAKAGLKARAAAAALVW